MSEKEQQFERIYKETENFGRTQFVREIQMQINDNKKKDKEIERLKSRLEEYQEYVKINHKEIERLNNIIKKLEEFIEREIELYTIELTEENERKLSIVGPIKGVYKEIYNVLQELKGSSNNEK